MADHLENHWNTKSQAYGFVWHRALDGSWDLFCPFGDNAATVWPNGCWSTWNERGVGGENGAEHGDVERAKLEVAAALLRQGWHTHRRRSQRARAARRRSANG